MQRRNFVALSTTALTAIPFMGFSAFSNLNVDGSVSKPEWLVKSIRDNDASVKSYAPSKITDPSNKYVGGYVDYSNLVNAGHNNGFLINAAVSNNLLVSPLDNLMSSLSSKCVNLKRSVDF